MSKKHYATLADCAKHYVAIKYGAKSPADYVCPYCRITEMEAQAVAVKGCQRYTVFEAVGGCELKPRNNGGLLKRRDALEALAQ